MISFDYHIGLEWFQVSQDFSYLPYHPLMPISILHRHCSNSFSFRNQLFGDSRYRVRLLSCGGGRQDMRRNASVPLTASSCGGCRRFPQHVRRELGVVKTMRRRCQMGMACQRVCYQRRWWRYHRISTQWGRMGATATGGRRRGGHGRGPGWGRGVRSARMRHHQRLKNNNYYWIEKVYLESLLKLQKEGLRSSVKHLLVSLI